VTRCHDAAEVWAAEVWAAESMQAAQRVRSSLVE
jgi:hypothetical protein